MFHPSRRALLIGAAALAGCSRAPKAPKAEPPKTIAEAVAGSWRSPADRARDRWRHPAESLGFWGLKPGATVVEFWPGSGWYTDILAPFLAATGGKLHAAHMQAGDPPDPSVEQMIAAYRAKYAAKSKLYGTVDLTAFGPTSGPVAPAASADLVLFLRNLHNWMAAGIAEKAYRDAFLALKPGGVLGVEEHRAAPGACPISWRKAAMSIRPTPCGWRRRQASSSWPPARSTPIRRTPANTRSASGPCHLCAARRRVANRPIRRSITPSTTPSARATA
jgi:predicted methyltransferase